MCACMYANTYVRMKAKRRTSPRILRQARKKTTRSNTNKPKTNIYEQAHLSSNLEASTAVHLVENLGEHLSQRNACLSQSIAGSVLYHEVCDFTTDFTTVAICCCKNFAPRGVCLPVPSLYIRKTQKRPIYVTKEAYQGKEGGRRVDIHI